VSGALYIQTLVEYGTIQESMYWSTHYPAVETYVCVW